MLSFKPTFSLSSFTFIRINGKYHYAGLSLVAQLVKKKKKSSCNAGDAGLISRLGISPEAVGSAVKNPPASAGDTGLIPNPGRSPKEGNGYPLQYSCLENLRDRGVWWATVHRRQKSGRQLSD